MRGGLMTGYRFIAFAIAFLGCGVLASNAAEFFRLSDYVPGDSVQSCDGRKRRRDDGSWRVSNVALRPPPATEVVHLYGNSADPW